MIFPEFLFADEYTYFITEINKLNELIESKNIYLEIGHSHTLDNVKGGISLGIYNAEEKDLPKEYSLKRLICQKNIVLKD